MKHVFVINPAAGQGQAAALPGELEAVCQAAGIDYEIYRTKGPGDGEEFVRETCRAHLMHDRSGDAAKDAAALRFYACGGDGTLHEVANGAAGFGGVEIGCIPAGTGDDFIRNFPAADFTYLPGQIRGEALSCDLIRYEGICDGRQVSRYCVNMFNIGFDCNVVDLTARIKRVPLVAGPVAYLTSVLVTLLEKKGANLRVEYADGFVYDGPLLLISVANGSFCGGGIKGLPRADVQDGRMDVSLVRNVSRRTFLRLFPKYMKGTHLEDQRLAGTLKYSHEAGLRISPNNDTMKLCVDGEICQAQEIRFRICPGAMRFVLPGGRK